MEPDLLLIGINAIFEFVSRMEILATGMMNGEVW
jgi:hypothetical protein